MTTWDEQFSPVMALGREPRAGQALLGQNIINAIAGHTNLVAEAKTGTGKSFAALIPMIHAAKAAKKAHKSFKGVISTETLTLQRQLIKEDLPFLHGLYGDFTYKKLMGRSNYVCFAKAKYEAKGNAKIDSMLQKLKIRSDDLGNGELEDAQRVLKTELTKDEWEALTGSSKFCGDNQCTPDYCWSSLARAEALKADIVVVNHAILVTDIEMKMNAGGGAFSDGMLGQIDVLVVDEAHSLEPVLVDQWTKEITDWEIQDMTGSVNVGLDTACSYSSNFTIADRTGYALEGIQLTVTNIQKFFMRIAAKEGKKWEDYEIALCEKTLSPSDPSSLLSLMHEYEEDNPKRLAKAEKALEEAIKFMKGAAEVAREQKGTGLRYINKGIRAAKDLLEACRIISKGLATKDGIVQEYGFFGCSVRGWIRKSNNQPGMTLSLVPLDVSTRAKALWQQPSTNILLSATLADLTDGSFNYARACVGFPDAPEMRVETPFSPATQQLVYITKADREQAEKGIYSFEELVDLLLATEGRALVLFTSRTELDWAAAKLTNMWASGAFPYQVMVQEKDANKDKLAARFKEDIHSVLLATKSFFTGFDAPGETLSLVALCKFPLPRFNVTCRQQMAYWRTRGFPKWYERKALTDLEQAYGRLVRSSGCRGILAMLDFRVIDRETSVYKTAATGMQATGSPYTLDLADVKKFLVKA